ncbi:hypothetical protein PIB30_072811 [Stylosanthes scabra]|uniref:Replication protein A 70 kDa DNA-binding subunit B/D first OB fold domain-containing protein n=1 Tax=Stylosanthes scabra TaxID=79078 RepID=A0ABU6ZN23_9FABA|nr:hypothetical protein [Stylosanthes scabra]
MAARVYKISEINPTIDNLSVRVRVMRLWTMLSYGSSLLPYAIEMIWLDEDGGKIHAVIKRNLVSRFVNASKEGDAYQITNFEVKLNGGNFRFTKHKYVIDLDHRTNVRRLRESNIPQYAFSFEDFDKINAVGSFKR